METNIILSDTRTLATLPTAAQVVAWPVTWPVALATYLDTRNNSRTRRAYERAVTEAMRALGTLYPADLEAPALAKYRSGLVDRLDPDRPDRLSPATVSLKLTALRGFLSFCRVTGIVRLSKDAIAFVLKSPSATVERPYQVLSATERARLMQAAQQRGARERALVTLALGAGLRVSELVGAHLGDFYQDDDGAWWLRVQMGKGRKDRLVPLAASVMDAVQAWIKASGRSLRRKADRETYLFATRQSSRMTAERARQLVKALVREAGISKPISPHSLRHTMAIETLRAGAGPVVVQKTLGHSSLATTQRYVDHLERADLARWAFSPV